MIQAVLENPAVEIAFLLCMSAILSFILGKVYVICGSSLSNRRVFASNFYLIAMTITLIITVVKSSLALSLGLVGALSIVRFRAAIKEPEELAYLFITIAVGLGFGAGLVSVTLVAFTVMVGIIFLIHVKHVVVYRPKKTVFNLTIKVNKSDNSTTDLDTLLAVLEEQCDGVEVRRFNETNDLLDVSFLIRCKKRKTLSKLSKSLLKIDKSMKILFLDNANVTY